METVTAVKIQSEYENPLKVLNPRTAIARLTNPKMRKGPVKSGLSAISKAAKTANNINDNPMNRR